MKITRPNLTGDKVIPKSNVFKEGVLHNNSDLLTMDKALLLTTVMGGAAPEIPILDTYPALAAFATVKLSSTAVNCVKLRRDSDDAVSDFGFAGTDLDQAAVTAWLAGANGFANTLYDQSGNSNNIVQATIAPNQLQPAYVGDVQNGHAAIRSDGVNDYMRKLSVAQNQPYTIYQVWIPRTLDSKQVFSGNGVYILQNITTARVTAGTALNVSNALAINTAVIVSAVLNGASSLISVNGGGTASGDAGAGAIDRLHVFSDAAASGVANIDLLALIVYTGAHDATTREAVETALSTTFDIPLA